MARHAGAYFFVSFATVLGSWGDFILKENESDLHLFSIPYSPILKFLNISETDETDNIDNGESRLKSAHRLDLDVIILRDRYLIFFSETKEPNYISESRN